jgi:type I restriction enzyme S subunit
MQVITENKVVPKLRFGNFSNSWDISKFDTYCNFQQGVQVDVELHKKKYEDGYIKFLRIENYTQKSNDFRFIPDLYKESKRIDEDDIVVVRYGATAGFIGRGFTGILANNLFKLVVQIKILFFTVAIYFIILVCLVLIYLKDVKPLNCAFIS